MGIGASEGEGKRIVDRSGVLLPENKAPVRLLVYADRTRDQRDREEEVAAFALLEDTPLTGLWAPVGGFVLRIAAALLDRRLCRF